MWWLWLLTGLVGVAVISLVVCGIITRYKLKMTLGQQGIKQAVINAVDTCSNVVTLTDLENRNTIQIRGDGVSYDVRQNDVIIV